MGQLIVHCQVTLNGAFEAPSPETWLLLDPYSVQASFEQLVLAEALVLGRKTYEGLAAVWPHLGDDPAMGSFADRITRCRSTWHRARSTAPSNGMPC